MDVFTITKSIGQLIQTYYDYGIFRRRALNQEFKFYITRQPLCEWFNYGRKYTSRYELYVDDESKPIEINGTIFDNKINYYLDTNSALAYGHVECITLSGKAPDGKIFNTTYTCHHKYGNFPIANLIIYTLILTALFGHEKVKWMFEYCFGSIKLEDRDLGDLIKAIQELKSIFNTASEKYDFLGLFYQQCMRHVIDIAQTKLAEYKIMV